MNELKKSRRRRSKPFVERSASAPRRSLKDACSMAWMWTLRARRRSRISSSRPARHGMTI
eukprot:11479933-Heterocapsa_arctica.AAC.1